MLICTVVLHHFCSNTPKRTKIPLFSPEVGHFLATAGRRQMHHGNLTNDAFTIRPKYRKSYGEIERFGSMTNYGYSALVSRCLFASCNFLAYFLYLWKHKQQVPQKSNYDYAKLLYLTQKYSSKRRTWV